jgi:predicted metal-dependent peptidase
MKKFEGVDLSKLSEIFDSDDPMPKKGDGQGEGDKKDKDDYGKLGKLLDSHDDWDNKINPETQQAIEEIREEAEIEVQDMMENQGKKRHGGRKAGSMPGLVMVELTKSARTYSVPWQNLMRNRIATIHKPLDSDTWARPHRKLYNQYPDIILPGPHEDQTSTSLIMFLIDTSASMGMDQVADGVGIVKTLPPDMYEVVIAWFDTEVYECADLNKPAGRGGTSFRHIEEVLTGQRPLYGKDFKKGSYATDYKPIGSNKLLEKYPDVVMVWTDGEASAPMPLHPERWIWLLDPKGTDRDAKKVTGSTIWRV